MSDKILLDEEEFLGKLGTALKLMGFDVSLIDSTDEYPLSLEGKLLGYEDTAIQMVMIFLPVQKAFDNQSQVLQVYFSLNEKDVPNRKKEKLFGLLNTFNMSSITGTFGYQAEAERVCYKQGVVIPQGTGMQEGLTLAMQTIMLMALNLDSKYDTICPYL